MMLVIKPAQSVDCPVIGPQVGVVGAPDGQMLDVPPVEVNVGLKDQGQDAGGHWGGGRGPGVRGGAVVVEVGGHHLPLAGRSRAVG